jgi:hypothetical protein
VSFSKMLIVENVVDLVLFLNKAVFAAKKML